MDTKCLSWKVFIHRIVVAMGPSRKVWVHRGRYAFDTGTMGLRSWTLKVHHGHYEFITDTMGLSWRLWLHRGRYGSIVDTTGSYIEYRSFLHYGHYETMGSSRTIYVPGTSWTL
jgi:hypothetical protein